MTQTNKTMHRTQLQDSYLLFLENGTHTVDGTATQMSAQEFQHHLQDKTS